MKSSHLRVLATLSVLGLTGLPAFAQGDVVELDSDRWDVKAGGVVEHLGRPSFAGTAFLKDVDLRDGVVQFDVAMDGRRSYPGIVFRVQSERDYERFYLRPHRAGLYPDALQYVPVFHGAAPWQLCHGEGFTAAAELPDDRWIRVRVEFGGSQAMVFLNDEFEPALEIHSLRHGVSRGTVGILTPADGTAFVSEFRYWEDDALEFPEPLAVELPPEHLTDWEISPRFPAAMVDTGAYPSFFTLFATQWESIEPEPDGIVSVSRAVPRSGQGPDCVFARTILRSDVRQRVKLSFGYSDEVTIFHNSRPVFSGDAAYRSRDLSFVGVVGLHDAIYLDLEEGLNEIFLILTETFGGWGFTFRADRILAAPVVDHGMAELLWETEPVFLTPESVQYDEARDVLYVTSFDRAFATRSEPSGFVSRLNLAGEIEELKWITGLTGPCGMALHGDRLYVAERGNLVEIDVPSGTIARRHPIPASVFINDVACDGEGIVYVSDSFPTTPDNTVVLYRLADGKVEPWLDDPGFSRVNGLYVHGNELLVGNTDDGTIRAVELATRRVRTIASIGAGVVDGIRADADGNVVASHWEGPTYRITPAGEIVEVLDPSGLGWNVADFELVRGESMLIAPTFSANRVAAWELKR